MSGCFRIFCAWSKYEKFPPTLTLWRAVFESCVSISVEEIICFGNNDDKQIKLFETFSLLEDVDGGEDTDVVR